MKITSDESLELSKFVHLLGLFLNFELILFLGRLTQSNVIGQQSA